MDTLPPQARVAGSALHQGLPRQVLHSDPSFSPLAAGVAFGSPVPLGGSSTRPKVQHSPPPQAAGAAMRCSGLDHPGACAGDTGSCCMACIASTL